MAKKVIKKAIPTKDVDKVKRTRATKGTRGYMISKKLFEDLCKIQCTEKEICSVLHCSNDTLNLWVQQNYVDEDGNPMKFLDVFKCLCDGGKYKIRRIQFEQAEKYPAMAIWLGKQYLGQSDRVENTNNEKVEFISDVPKVDEVDE